MAMKCNQAPDITKSLRYLGGINIEINEIYSKSVSYYDKYVILIYYTLVYKDF